MAPYYVCPNCGSGEEIRAREMRPKTNGVHVIEMAEFGPAAIWSADLWACPTCNERMIAGFGLNPIVEHYQDNFEALLANTKGSDHVYYC